MRSTLALLLTSLAAAQPPGLLPRPRRWLPARELPPLPAACRLEAPALPADDPGLQALRAALAARGCKEEAGAPFAIRAALWPDPGAARRALAGEGCPEELPAGREAFALRLGPAGAYAGALAPRPLSYALRALACWLEGPDPLPAGWILDWPSLSHRAFMLDLARLVERQSYYEKVLAFLARMRVNVLVLHLTDDPTLAFRFASHPEPADPHAWTAAAMGEFVALARRHHVELLPEIELFGHAGGWVRHPAYSRLAEPGRNVLSPHREGTYPLIHDLVAEAAALFPCPFLHAGCDEVADPTSPEGRSFVKEHGKGRWLAAHLERLHEIVAGSGKRMAIWGDMLLRHPEAAGLLPRDVLVYDWQYHPDFDDRTRRWRTLMPPESWTHFRELGFEVVAAPALMSGRHRLWPDAERLANTLKTARLAAAYGLTGVCVTVWVPTRFLPDSVWPAYAQAAAACWEGTAFAPREAEAAFLRAHFGLEPGQGILDALGLLRARTPVEEDLRRLLWTDEKSRAAFLQKGAVNVKGCLAEVEAALARLEAAGQEVRRHGDDWEELLRVARVVRLLAWREARGREILAGAEGLDEECQRRTREVLEQVRASWRVHRYEDTGQGYDRDSYVVRHHLLKDLEDALGVKPTNRK